MNTASIKEAKPDVFERRYVWPMEEKKIRRGENAGGAGHLTGTHDFMAFLAETAG